MVIDIYRLPKIDVLWLSASLPQWLKDIYQPLTVAGTAPGLLFWIWRTGFPIILRLLASVTNIILISLYS